LLLTEIRHRAEAHRARDETAVGVMLPGLGATAACKTPSRIVTIAIGVMTICAQAPA
jgi:hypothetical protein